MLTKRHVKRFLLVILSTLMIKVASSSPYPASGKRESFVRRQHSFRASSLRML
ncbi:hypothetical protein ACEPAH_4023 [Sanghuangporus vaninii]